MEKEVPLCAAHHCYKHAPNNTLGLPLQRGTQTALHEAPGSSTTTTIAAAGAAALRLLAKPATHAGSYTSLTGEARQHV